MVRPSESPTGDVINYRGIVHAPRNESEVIALFAALAPDLGYRIESIRAPFPDGIVSKKTLKGWIRLKAEFEVRSTNFLKHNHDPKGCDKVICWFHDWKDCPIDVLELQMEISKLPERPRVAEFYRSAERDKHALRRRKKEGLGLPKPGIAVEFDRSFYDFTNTGRVLLRAPKFVRRKMSFIVQLSSSADPKGIRLTAFEIEPNSGVYEAKFGFARRQSKPPNLLVTYGDTVSASLGKGRNKITATATVGAPAPAMPSSTTATQTLSPSGIAKSTFSPGQTLLASATVQNTTSTPQPYLLAIQMSAPDGTVYPTLFISVTLNGGQSFTFSPGFALPKDAQKGTWSFQVSVFDKFPAQGGKVKANPVTQTFTVA